MSKPVRPPRPKIPWRRLDGVLLLDKASGMSSNDALQKARRLCLAEKGGHTGTLDPMASGLLPLCLGEATKFSHDLLDADKTYLATLKLGERTNTGDAEGEVIETRPVQLDRLAVEAVLPRFRGAQTQVPPMYSALKRDGVPLYKLARQGIEVERAERQITIHELELVRCELSEECSVPIVELRVRCSKGTYVRTLGEDIGAALGCGAHLVALRRTTVGRLDLERAVTLEQLAAAIEAGRLDEILQSPDSLLAELPCVTLPEEAKGRFCNGNPVAGIFTGDTPVGQRFRVYSVGVFLGLAECDARGGLAPKRLVRPPVEA
jgi:tRNA pseudouridine55 synthase